MTWNVTLKRPNSRWRRIPDLPNETQIKSSPLLTITLGDVDLGDTRRFLTACLLSCERTRVMSRSRQVGSLLCSREAMYIVDFVSVHSTEGRIAYLPHLRRAYLVLGEPRASTRGLEIGASVDHRTPLLRGPGTGGPNEHHTLGPPGKNLFQKFATVEQAIEARG